jgi:HlyD family secretion protein
MSLSSDASPREAGSNVLKFPGSLQAGRPGWLRLWQTSRSRLTRHGFTVTVIAVAVAGISAGLWSFSAAGISRYTTVPVARGSIARAVTARGTINPARTIVLGANIPGTIQALGCDYDSDVKAGQVCAKIDPRPYQATLDQYSGQLLRDQAILDKDRADLARLRRHAAGNPFMRQQVADQGLVVSRDEGTVKLDHALVDSAKLNLGYTDVVAPADGTVVSRNVSEGQPVAANLSALFLIAADPKHMEVVASPSQSDIGAIRQGDVATMTIESIPDRVFSGTVSQVRRSPQSLQSAATYDAVVTVDNPDLVLKPGMTASARIVVEQRNDVLRVPDQALQFNPSPGKSQAVPAPAASTASSPATFPLKVQSEIWVLRGSVPVAVNIVTGLDDGNFTEIAQGDLNPGDQVIVGENRPQANTQQGAP